MVRRKFVNTLQIIMNSLLSHTNEERMFIKTNKFIKDNSLYLTRADKGNISVLMDTQIYIQSVQNILSYSNTYIKIQKDSTEVMQNKLNAKINGWYQSNFKDKKQKIVLLLIIPQFQNYMLFRKFINLIIP